MKVLFVIDAYGNPVRKSIGRVAFAKDPNEPNSLGSSDSVNPPKQIFDHEEVGKISVFYFNTTVRLDEHAQQGEDNLMKLVAFMVAWGQKSDTFILDCTNILSIDDVFLGKLNALKKAKKLAFCNANDDIKNKLSQHDPHHQIYMVFDTREEALKSLGTS